MKLTHIQNLVNDLIDGQVNTKRMDEIRSELIHFAINLKGHSISAELHAWNECVKQHIHLSAQRLKWPAYPCDIADILYLLQK
ncbi:MAG: hypothetical protein EOO20_10045 [Chryseobacterium sp.]|nr:MAG: hypothetical protein EOO20_10045 [Chryseobacterium sp.]